MRNKLRIVRAAANQTLNNQALNSRCHNNSQGNSINGGKNKRGQISVFLIIAILIGVIILLGYYASNYSAKSKLPRTKAAASLDMMPVNNYITQCLHDVSTDAVYIAGTQGGYALQPLMFVHSLENDIGFGYYRGLDVLPSKAYIEKEIAAYITVMSEKCTNLTMFREQGISVDDVNAGNLSVGVIIGKEDVAVEMRLPVTANVNRKMLRSESFRTTVNIRLGEILAISRQVVQRHVADNDLIPADYLVELGNYDYTAQVIPHNSSIFIYSITDKKKAEKGRPEFSFLFAYEEKYDFPPEILAENDIMLSDGEQYKLRIPAYDPDDDNLSYSVIGGMFSINQSGWYEFTPEIPGSFTYLITVTDPHGKSSTKAIRYIVAAKSSELQLFVHDIIAKAGSKVEDSFEFYGADAADANQVSFSADKSWFRIDNSGKFSFVPDKPGNFTVKITMSSSTSGSSTPSSSTPSSSTPSSSASKISKTVNVIILEPDNHAPEIRIPQLLTAELNKEFEYDIEVFDFENDAIVCRSDFFIGEELENCRIKFIPRVEFERRVTIAASDGKESSSKTFVLKAQ